MVCNRMELTEPELVLEYLHAHHSWSIRDPPILKSVKRTVMVLNRLIRQRHPINMVYDEIRAESGALIFVSKWILEE